jgi:hypothetical protein
VVTARLGTDAIRDVWTAVIAVSAAILLFRRRVNATWLVLGGAAIGVVLEAVL